MEATTNRLNSSSSEAFRLVVLFYEEDALTWSDTTAPSSTPYSPHSLIQHCTIQFRDHSGPQCYKECLADGALLRMARRGSNSISPSSPEPPDLQPVRRHSTGFIQSPSENSITRQTDCLF